MKEKIKYILNALIKRGYWFNNVFFEGCRKMTMYSTFNTDVINLGSTSAVHAFNYDGLGLKAGNWAMTRNPLLGDYAILKNYSSFLKKDRSIVIITLCPFSSLAGSYNFLDDRYYTFLYPSTIPNYSYAHDLEVKSKWNTPLNYYPVFGLLSDIRHFIVKKSDRCLSEDELQLDADTKMNAWMHEFSIKDFTGKISLKNQDAISDAAELINNMIDYCMYKHAIPVIVIPPMYRSLVNKFTPAVKNILFDKLLLKINDINRSVRIINYMDNSNFINDRTLYKDSFLLNEKGAKLFTRQLLSELCVI